MNMRGDRRGAPAACAGFGSQCDSVRAEELTPSSVLAIGVTREEVMDYWPCVKRCDVLLGASFAEAVRLPVADMVVVGCADRLFAELWNEQYVAKLAMFCRDVMIWHGCERISDSDMVSDDWAKELSRFPAWYAGQGIGEPKRLTVTLDRYFKLVRRADRGVETTVLFRRKRPPLIVDNHANRHLVTRMEDSFWRKTGYPESQVMEYLTVLQNLKAEGTIRAIVCDPKGCFRGVEMAHLPRSPDADSATRLFWRLYHAFAPIGYLPHDVIRRYSDRHILLGSGRASIRRGAVVRTGMPQHDFSSGDASCFWAGRVTDTKSLLERRVRPPADTGQKPRFYTAAGYPRPLTLAM